MARILTKPPKSCDSFFEERVANYLRIETQSRQCCDNQNEAGICASVSNLARILPAISPMFSQSFYFRYQAGSRISDFAFFKNLKKLLMEKTDEIPEISIFGVNLDSSKIF